MNNPFYILAMCGLFLCIVLTYIVYRQSQSTWQRIYSIILMILSLIILGYMVTHYLGN
jgi:VIT1/CCC1 family predicted Fe2+/Mn2+ transporter